nr:immunoglobulin heavy chain junction region [Mus musculus]
CVRDRTTVGDYYFDYW